MQSGGEGKSVSSLIKSFNSNKTNNLFVRYVVEQPQSTTEETEECIRSRDVMKMVYKALSGYAIGEQESALIVQEGCSPAYGEMTYESLFLLASELHMTRDDIFYDLGSGVGKPSMFFHLCSPSKKSVGIELSSTRHQIALQAKLQLQQLGYLDPERELNYIEANFLQEDLSDATVILLCNTCFSDELNLTCADQLSRLKTGLRIIALRRLPETPLLGLVKVIPTSMSWCKDAYMFFHITK